MHPHKSLRGGFLHARAAEHPRRVGSASSRGQAVAPAHGHERIGQAAQVDPQALAEQDPAALGEGRLRHTGEEVAPIVLPASSPGGETYYARKFGPVAVVTLDEYLSSYDAPSDQAKWLDATLAGFAAGKLRTDSVRAPIAPAGGGVRTIEGFVVDVASPGQGGPRLLLAPIQISGLSPAETPIRVRVTLQDDDTLPAPGTVVSVRGMLNAPPPPPPASPGSYDFARDAFFDGIGGVETSHDCDRWSCAPRAGVATPRVAAIMTRRASTIVRKLPLFCDWAEVVIVRG